ncbi:flagellar assembly protein A [Sulfurospirillum arcachonense]|uniref:flagellar assembly protein A n=1 Tax=Sulfurospirillum arcachonense TaxID=57666 RepID=UPI000469C413|nr:flagellar assembly protein A [Sulfurospirillum arcachonense]
MIKPVKVITDNVSEELRHVASENSILDSTLRIEINSITTLVQTADTDFVEVAKDALNTYKEEKSLRDNTLEFKQQYDIKIKSKRTDYTFKDVYSEIEFEENDTLAYLVIKQGSRLKYEDGLYDGFLEYITEQKLRANIMLYLFDIDYESTIKEFVNLVQKITLMTFKEDKKILIAKSVNATDGVVSKLIKNIEEKSDVQTKDSTGKVDHSNRGVFINCTQDEQLFEFIKPQQGEHGRTCKGDIIEAQTINLDDAPTFTVDDSIEVQDSLENIKYLSTKNGFLIKNANQYSVINNLEIDEISFKTTGTINADLDADITINVTKNDPLEDAVAEGMHITVKHLVVRGNVGPNTKIKTDDISIGGQTHNRSSIKCIDADIKQHRGKIIGREIKINTLEGGEVVADKAIIEHAVRGKIKAKTIQIGTLGSNVTMESPEYIQVDMITGGENTFVIDTSIVSAFDEEKKAKIDYGQKLKDELKLLLASLKESAEKVQKNLAPCKKIQAMILKNKNEGVNIPDVLIKNLKSCKAMMARYKKFKEDVADKKNQLEKAKSGQLESNLAIFDAKIVVKKPIKGFNSIVYRLSNPDREIVLKTDKSMSKPTFKIREDYNGVLKIVNVN